MFNNKLDELDKIPVVLNPNVTKIPITRFPMTEEGIESFNEVYFLLKEYCKNFNPIQWTAKHYIKRSGRFRLPQWDVSAKATGVEITVLSEEGMFRVFLKTGFLTKKDADSKKISGGTAFKKFKEICKKHDIELEDYSIENGEEIKKTIPKAPKYLEKPYYEGLVFEHVYHIDLNSSYMAGVAKQYPALAPAIKEIYAMRNSNEIYKKVLTNSWGYLQSEYVSYRFSHLSKAGIEYNNYMLATLTSKLKEQGFTIISYNTDGIWYTGNGKVYHDENEGTELGQWKTDHKDCIFEAKSAGAYQFIEDGVHQVVISGITRLDRTKSREDWTWEDFHNSSTEVLKIKFDFEKGAYINEENSRL